MAAASDRLPEALRDFISRSFDSVEKLETVLLMRNDPSRKWTAAELSAALRSHESSLDARLHSLVADGLVVMNEEGDRKFFNYRCATTELEDFMTELMEAYLVRRYSVINTIYTGSSRELKALSDAFNFKKGGKDS